MPSDIRSFFGGQGDRLASKEPPSNVKERVRMFPLCREPQDFAFDHVSAQKRYATISDS